MATDDVVILLGDGVYAANTINQREVFVLEEDCTIRGVQKIGDMATTISYSDMVSYCAENYPIVSWSE